MQDMIDGRCGWCGTDGLYVKYHDEEWGRPVTDDGKLFEFLVLERPGRVELDNDSPEAGGLPQGLLQFRRREGGADDR